jgi:glucokinase
MSDIVLAADLGGTNLRMAAVGPGGSILARSKCETPRSDPEEIVSAIVWSAGAVLGKAYKVEDVRAIGIAIPAMSIDPDGGVVRKAANLSALNGFPLGRRVSGELGRPVLLENDANAAAIGESWIGASAGLANSLCITLGTGIGGGIVINGSILRGPDWSAGEVGHICVEPLGQPCGCGSRGCVEQYASATAIVRMTAELLPDRPDSLLSGRTNPTAADIFEAGKAGDELALEVFRKMGFYLGIALANLINILNPDVIVIGGGVADGWDLFIGPLRTEIERRAYSEPAKRAKLVRAELGDDAGLLGAARIAFLDGI